MVFRGIITPANNGRVLRNTGSFLFEMQIFVWFAESLFEDDSDRSKNGSIKR